jgi:beta-lactamase class A
MLGGGLALAATGCSRSKTMTASRTPTLDTKRLAKEVPALAERARPGVLGFGLMNLESGERWVLNGDRRFPMQSVFKAPLGAAALSEVDAGRLSLDEVLTIRDVDLSPFWSPVSDAWPARRNHSVGELLAGAVVESDNTAADVLMKRIGGPGAVTAWLQAKRINDLRLDRYERDMQADARDAPSFRAEWRGPAYWAQIQKVEPARRLAAMRAYMADPRDTATPNAMLHFLAKLDAGELLSAASSQRMIQLMRATTRGNDRLKAGLPPNVLFAHRPGTSGRDLGLTMAFNDVGILTLPDKRSYAVAAFLSGATADEAAQAALFADLGRLTARSLN